MISSIVPNADLLKKDKPASKQIPYRNFAGKNTLKTDAGDYVRMFRIGGIAHETADDEDINSWHRQLGNFYRNIASPQVAMWQNLCRREESRYPDGQFPPGFARDLDEKWRERCVSGAPMLVNELYLSIVFRPQTTSVGKFAQKLDNMSAAARAEERAHALQELDTIEKMLMSSLQRYEPSVLETYEENGTVWTEAGEFIAYLINGEVQKIPMPRMDLRKALATSRPLFGSETIALRGLQKTTYGALLAIKEYTARTGPGILDDLLTVPFEFVLTQSFSFYTKAAAMDMMVRQENIMTASGDHAQSQIEELQQARDDLESNEFSCGQYHLSLLVKSDEPKKLRDFIGVARTVFSDSGMVLAQEDLANEAAFWSMLPGNFALRPRPAFATTRNFAGLAALHNFPAGRRERNHWGAAVALVRTVANSPFYFNFHRGDVGNTLIVGPTGSGKTVTQAFLLSMLQKLRPLTVFFDKDKGAKIYVKRMGGVYQDVRNGKPTGWNPFQMEPTESNMAAIETLMTLVGRPATPTEEKQLSRAIADVFTLPKHLRRISALLESLDVTAQDGLYYRIQRWTQGNALGWVFDSSVEDSIDFEKHSLYGFDMTELLDNAAVRPVALFYLMHRMQQVIDGRRFTCFMDEFWKMLLDDIFEDFAQNKLKVIRKENGFLVFGTQSPKDTLKSPIAHTIIEQCPTFILLPNPRATPEDYIDGFHLTEREFFLVKEGMGERSGRMLVKQGENSVVLQLDLRGMDNEMAILSGNAVTVGVYEAITDELGTDDPAVWEPLFHEFRKLAKADGDKIDRVVNLMKQSIDDAETRDPGSWLPIFREKRKEQEAQVKKIIDDAARRAKELA